MLSSGLPPVLLVLSVLELSWCLSDEEKIILDEHNKYRSQVSPPAKAMMKMTWDTDLEVGAQSYAEKCKWDHNGSLGRLNLFATASALDVKLAIEEWNGEEKFYNVTASECVPGQSCDNYIQVIWAETTRVGCGSSCCEKIDGIETESMHLLVCNYYPGSNIKEKKPYREGPSCEMCPRSTVCVNNLCEQETNSDQTSVDLPKGGAPSTCLGLSLFLLPSAILVGLLL
ncbi:peptidase inhibitor 16-like isoform X2 [Motacilla alba alba]|uniref:peptidase inhibitor 16-like isoform X2 n=1 Tax=Motacilla alba alba TaxID=1094192 RepID=UPI0018D4FC64|nr:peptidase inhibitor 16-like isoform X2 [Motacilla alba alba]